MKKISVILLTLSTLAVYFSWVKLMAGFPSPFPFILAVAFLFLVTLPFVIFSLSKTYPKFAYPFALLFIISTAYFYWRFSHMPFSSGSGAATALGALGFAFLVLILFINGLACIIGVLKTPNPSIKRDA